MKEQLLIIGAGGLGRMLLEVAREKYDCFFVDDAFEINTVVCDSCVIGHLSDLDTLKYRFFYAVVGIGNNKLRKEITSAIIKMGFHVPTICSSYSYISPYSQLGYGTIVLPFASIQNGAKIGGCSIIASQVEIHHDCFVGNYVTIYPNTTIRTNAKILDGSKIGSNVTIGNDVVIKEEECVLDGAVR